GFTLGQNPTSLNPISTLPPVPNEFGASNTRGSIAMAQLGGNPNSGTDEFYFNLVDNSRALDPQKFAVFGQVAGPIDQQVLNDLALATVTNEGGVFASIPLNNFRGPRFPTDATPSNFDLVNDVVIVSRNESLTYTVVGNSNPGLVTTSLTNE